MKKTMFILILLAGFFGSASAQHYSEMPVDVQKKMDQNKASGLALYEGVMVDYELTIEGVTNEATAAEFKSLLKKECGLISFAFTASNKHVTFTVPAKYNLEGMKPVIKGSSFGFGLFFKERYHL